MNLQDADPDLGGFLIPKAVMPSMLLHLNGGTKAGMPPEAKYEVVCFRRRQEWNRKRACKKIKPKRVRLRPSVCIWY